jgi:hypothetical protein
MSDRVVFIVFRDETCHSVWSTREGAERKRRVLIAAHRAHWATLAEKHLDSKRVAHGTAPCRDCQDVIEDCLRRAEESEGVFSIREEVAES